MGYEWMASGVYAITNKVTGEQYVGCGKMFCLRWLRHVTNLDRGVHHNHALQRAWNEYGKDAFDFSILEVVTDANTDTLRDRERAWISDVRPAYNTLQFGPRAQIWPMPSDLTEGCKWATLRQAREAHNLSLTDLARKSGVDMSTLSRIEHSHRLPSAKTIQAIATALDCTPADLGWNRQPNRALPSLQLWRVRRMMLQTELAKAAGIALTTAHTAEHGRPVSSSTAQKLADALGVTPEQLYQEPPAAPQAIA